MQPTNGRRRDPWRPRSVTVTTVLVCVSLWFAAVWRLNQRYGRQYAVFEEDIAEATLLGHDNAGPSASADRPADAMPLGATGNNLFWMVHISDLHVSRYNKQGGIHHLRSFLHHTLPALQPLAVLVTGDLTDAKDRLKLGSLQHEEEWRRYDDLLTFYGITRTEVHAPTDADEAGTGPAQGLTAYWFDQRGNHDCFDVPGHTFRHPLNYFRHFSRTKSNGYAHRFQLPFGQYDIVALDSCPKHGPARPFNFFGYLDHTDMDHLEKQLVEPKVPSNHTFVLNHYPISTMVFSKSSRGTTFVELSRRFTLFLNGHLHNLIVGLGDELYARHPTGFLELEVGDVKENGIVRILVVDHDTISFRDVPMHRPAPPANSSTDAVKKAWEEQNALYDKKLPPHLAIETTLNDVGSPIMVEDDKTGDVVIVITTPKEARFVIPQREPLYRQRHSTHIRFLLFTPGLAGESAPRTKPKTRELVPGITSVEIYIDDKKHPHAPMPIPVASDTMRLQPRIPVPQADGTPVLTGLPVNHQDQMARPLWVSPWNATQYVCDSESIGACYHTIEIRVTDVYGRVHRRIETFNLHPHPTSVDRDLRPDTTGTTILTSGFGAWVKFFFWAVYWTLWAALVSPWVWPYYLIFRGEGDGKGYVEVLQDWCHRYASWYLTHVEMDLAVLPFLRYRRCTTPNASTLQRSTRRQRARHADDVPPHGDTAPLDDITADRCLEARPFITVTHLSTGDANEQALWHAMSKKITLLASYAALNRMRNSDDDDDALGENVVQASRPRPSTRQATKNARQHTRQEAHTDATSVHHMYDTFHGKPRTVQKLLFQHIMPSLASYIYYPITSAVGNMAIAPTLHDRTLYFEKRRVRLSFRFHLYLAQGFATFLPTQGGPAAHVISWVKWCWRLCYVWLWYPLLRIVYMVPLLLFSFHPFLPSQQRRAFGKRACHYHLLLHLFYIVIGPWFVGELVPSDRGIVGQDTSALSAFTLYGLWIRGEFVPLLDSWMYGLFELTYVFLPYYALVLLSVAAEPILSCEAHRLLEQHWRTFAASASTNQDGNRSSHADPPPEKQISGLHHRKAQNSATTSALPNASSLVVDHTVRIPPPWYRQWYARLAMVAWCFYQGVNAILISLFYGPMAFVLSPAKTLFVAMAITIILSHSLQNPRPQY